MRIINLASGSKGNCTLIEHGNTKILVDIGIGVRTLNERLKEAGSNLEGLNAIFVSHNHIDHIKSVVAIANKYNVPVFAPRECYQDEKLKDLEKKLKNEINLVNINIGEIEIETFEVPHDALKTIAFIFYADGNKVSLVTDLGILSEVAMKRMEKSNLIMLESNYDDVMLANGPYPASLKKRISSTMGHLSNKDCAKAILEFSKKGTDYFMLMHLSETNNTPQIAYNTVMNVLYNEYGEQMPVTILLAWQNAISPNFIFKPRDKGEL